MINEKSKIVGQSLWVKICCCSLEAQCQANKEKSWKKFQITVWSPNYHISSQTNCSPQTSQNAHEWMCVDTEQALAETLCHIWLQFLVPITSALGFVVKSSPDISFFDVQWTIVPFPQISQVMLSIAFSTFYFVCSVLFSLSLKHPFYFFLSFLSLTLFVQNFGCNKAMHI